MSIKDWPKGDQKWAQRYVLRLVVEGHGRITHPIHERRQQELIAGLVEARVPAIELYGDPDVLAKADAADPATIDRQVKFGRQLTDDQWFARFETALRTSGVRRHDAREHAQTLCSDLTTTASEEYGDPKELASQLADQDAAATRRRWRWELRRLIAYALLTVLLGVASGHVWLYVVATIALVIFGYQIWRLWQARPKVGSV